MECIIDIFSRSSTSIWYSLMLTPGSPGVCTLDSLDANACDFYKDNGFLVITNAVTPDGLAELAAETVAVCRGEYGQVSRSPQAVGGPLTDEMLAEMPAEELISHFLCIHHPHKISATFERYLAHPAIVAALTKVIGPNVKCMQSMLFVKSSGKPGQAWHQDEDYIPTRDRSLTGAWIAIDDATVENGCLWVIPGSQRRGILYPQYPHDDSDYDCSVMSYNFPYDESVDAIPVEVPAGSIVFFNGYLLHKSLPNRAPEGTFRRVLVNHYMSAESLLPWQFSPGVPIAKQDYRDIVMIAGEDPYAWKGLDDSARPSVRSAGYGGCGDGRSDLEAHLQKPVSERRSD